MNELFNDNVSLKTEIPAIAKHVLPAVPTSDVYLEDCVTALYGDIPIQILESGMKKK